MNPQQKLPLFKSHKRVRAMRIAKIKCTSNTPGATLFSDTTEILPIVVTEQYLLKHRPKEGGYYVVYDDGYESFSPAEAFESGYTPVEEITITVGTVAPAHPLDRIARVCHEVNRAYCEALGDHSQPSWEQAPAWQRESARMGVDLHLMGEFGPEASHISWMRQKLDDGWKYGPVKDPEKKEHPCLVPFAELPVEQQAKDFIFRAIVHALK